MSADAVAARTAASHRASARILERAIGDSKAATAAAAAVGVAAAAAAGRRTAASRGMAKRQASQLAPASNLKRSRRESPGTAVAFEDAEDEGDEPESQPPPSPGEASVLLSQLGLCLVCKMEV